MSKAAKIQFRKYKIRLPEPLANALDAGLNAQRQMEDRPIETSEYWAWLLMLGMQSVHRMNEAARQAEQRIITPTNGAPQGRIVL
jgi:hypothetical protein